MERALPEACCGGGGGGESPSEGGGIEMEKKERSECFHSIWKRVFFLFVRWQLNFLFYIFSSSALEIITPPRAVDLAPPLAKHRE